MVVDSGSFTNYIPINGLVRAHLLVINVDWDHMWYTWNKAIIVYLIEAI